MGQFAALGVIKNVIPHSKENTTQLLRDFNVLFESSQINKGAIIQLLNEHLSDFAHIETGKSLDQKM
jgi:hypothetical protein